MRMEKYSEYQLTNIEWLPQIPKHWKLETLRKFIRMVSVKNHPEKPLLSVTREGGVIVRDVESKEKNHNFIPEDLSGYKYVEVGDFCINKMKSWQGSYGVSEYEGIVSPAYYICKLNGVERRFFSVAIRSINYVCFFAQYSKGIRVDQWDLSPIGLKTIPFFLPPVAEQRSIVSYLDTKCSLLDTLLSNKEKEISLLQEMKQRVIADAVTRGVNPNVRFKATNIPWLPEIPEHWEIKRAKNLFKKEQRPVQEGDEIVTCFRDGEVTLRKNRRISGFTEATDYSHYQHICKGDLVIHQMDAFAGSSGVSESDGMGTPVLSVCTPKSDSIDNYYYAYVLRLMGKNGFILSLYRGIRERSSDFRFETFVKQWLPVPPLSEQRAIVSYITERTSKIDTLIEKLTKEIECVKEYKQRLISDVVTGQVKVC